MRWSVMVLVAAALVHSMPAAGAPARAKRRPVAPPPAPAAPATPPAPVEPAAYAVVAVGPDTELAVRNPDQQWPAASLAKMMTTLLALEQVRAGKRSLAEPVRVSARAAAQGGSQVYLKAGETLPLGELLSAVMIASANDAAVAVAEHLGGSVEAFVRRMNARARALDMRRTVYQTPNGLPPAPGQASDLTTARDLVRVARALLGHPEALRWSGSTEAPFRHGATVIRNTNRLLTRFAGATGLKTGHTQAAGFSVTASATRGDLTLVAVVLGLPTRSACVDAASGLLSDAFERYRVLVAASPGVPVGTVPVTGGTEGSVKAVPAGALRLVVPRGEERQLAIEPGIPRQVAAPVAPDQRLGDLVVRLGQRELGRVALQADAGVEAASWLAWLWPGGRTAQAAR